MRQEKEYGNHYAYLELNPSQAATAQEISMVFKATRHENRVDLKAPGAAPAQASRAELTRSLERDRLVPLDGMIADLSRSETKNQEKPLDKARAIYTYVLSTMRYDKTGEGWGKGDAIFACNEKRGNCTDFHALFIGMMRAASIPARFEIGFPLPRDKNAGEIGGYHCWAQFWVDGRGWVPVDASEAWKDASRRDYFFGAHDANRILFSRGRDIQLDPPQEGQPLNYFVYPYAELDGKPWTGLQSKFSFRDLSSS
jgi:transglutaminase-like putative cysteine protease